MERDNRNDATPYAVYCNGTDVGIGTIAACGLVFLDEKEYEVQMYHSNSLWCCPKCGAEAIWDDECQETNPQEALP